MQTPNLKTIATDYQTALNTITRRIIICAGTGCVANGAMDVHDRFVEEFTARGMDVRVELDVHDCAPKDNATLISRSGCQGFCQMGPLVSVDPEGLLYVKVRPDDVTEIIETTFLQGDIVERLLYHDPRSGEVMRGKGEIPFYTRQTRRILKNCGEIDAEDMNEYIATGGYLAAEKAFTQMTPEDICQNVLDSGIRGRGGGGFPTGRKWELTRGQPAGKKYVICNGDEGDPGAFMDRSVMEGNPHAVIEGMLIAARAIGADEGYVYVRVEYPLAVEHL
ncbi:MAG: NADH-quinone oxidoreductase subunit F, partial [Phycisphaerales bacterium]|nr:NADH-quinone oxidoreductase subunit F [Phycisphaerales bacterium]